MRERPQTQVITLYTLVLPTLLHVHISLVSSVPPCSRIPNHTVHCCETIFYTITNVHSLKAVMSTYTHNTLLALNVHAG